MQDLFKFNLQLFAESEDHSANEELADPQLDEEEIIDPTDDEPEGEPDGDDPEAENPDQPERTSKQPPEVDAAFAAARRAQEKAEQLERELQQFREKDAETQAKQQEQAANQQVISYFQGRFQQRRDAFINDGYDEGLADQLARTQTDIEYARWEQQQEKEKAKQEAEQRTQQSAIEQAKSTVMNQYKDLKKEYPDLLPDGITNFDELIAKSDPQIIEKMQRGLLFDEAFQLVNRTKIAERDLKKQQAKAKANADRATGSGRNGGDPQGGSFGLTKHQQDLAKENGIPFKVFAQRMAMIQKK